MPLLGEDSGLAVISLGAREINLVAFSVSLFSFRANVPIFLLGPELEPCTSTHPVLRLSLSSPLGTHLQSLLFPHQPRLSRGRPRFLLAPISEDPTSLGFFSPSKGRRDFVGTFSRKLWKGKFPGSFL